MCAMYKKLFRAYNAGEKAVNSIFAAELVLNVSGTFGASPFACLHFTAASLQDSCIFVHASHAGLQAPACDAFLAQMSASKC